jgi:hypothetical protein
MEVMDLRATHTAGTRYTVILEVIYFLVLNESIYKLNYYFLVVLKYLL